MKVKLVRISDDDRAEVHVAGPKGTGLSTVCGWMGDVPRAATAG